MSLLHKPVLFFNVLCKPKLLFHTRSNQANHPSRDHYHVLGVSPLATKEEIKSAYYALSKKYHPDSSPDEGNARLFSEVSEAYKVLSNEKARADYDLLNDDFPVWRSKEEELSTRRPTKSQVERDIHQRWREQQHRRRQDKNGDAKQDEYEDFEDFLNKANLFKESANPFSVEYKSSRQLWREYREYRRRRREQESWSYGATREDEERARDFVKWMERPSGNGAFDELQRKNRAMFRFVYVYLPVFILLVTGAILVYENAIDENCNPEYCKLDHDHTKSRVKQDRR